MKKQTEIKRSEEQKKSGHGFSVLDAIGIFLIVACIAGAVIKAGFGEKEVNNEEKEMTDYAVTCCIRSEKSSFSKYISEGDIFFFENGDMFGVSSGSVTVTPAVIYSEDENGKYVMSYSAAENGDNSLVDISFTVSVKGYETEYGFAVNGTDYIAPNFETVLHTEKAGAAVLIENITPVSE